VWLLKHFLYRPILNAIDAREKHIAAKIAEAEEKEKEAQQQREDYLQKNKVFDQQRNARMNEVLESAKAERTQLLDAARREAEDLRIRLEQALRNERHSLNEELSRRAREEIFSIAGKMLSDLAGVSLEQRMVEIFIEHLRELDAEKISELKSSSKISSDALRVRTAFKLSAQQRATLETVIAEISGKKIEVEYTIETNLVSGIEISSNGRKIAWSVADYLGSLAKSVDDLLKNKSETGGVALSNAAATTEGSDSNEH